MGGPGFKSRRPDELNCVKTVLADAVREVGDLPDFSVRYGKATGNVWEDDVQTLYLYKSFRMWNRVKILMPDSKSKNIYKI